MKRQDFMTALAVGLILFLFACAPRKFLVRPAPEITRFNRVAVFPLENLSGVPEAGSRVTAIMVSELYNSNLVDVVEQGEVQQFILRSRIRVAGQLDLDTIREASRQLNADAIMFGSVNEYSELITDLGPLPAVSITVRIVDASSGEIVWAVTHSLQGDFKESLFGIGRVNSPVALSEFVVEDVLEALGVAMYPGDRELYESEISRTVRRELMPSRSIDEPVIPLAPTRAEMQAIESEKERAHGAVLQEWETIKGLSE